ncbi:MULTISPECIES: hypothetical protein [Aphanothece]|uniref:hypothetical protein n=1 Tax=Aphanothece TaxID=1121 RepID=UPI0039855E9C
MALFVLLTLGAVATLSALGNWRSGLIWMLVIAAVQDPLRKLVPGAPGSLLLIVIPVFLATGFGLISARRHVWLGFQSSFPAVARSLGWFVVACLPAALLSLTYGPGSWAFTAFGVLSYGIILSSILIGFYYLRSERELRRLLAIYCLITAVALTGTFLEYFKVDALADIVGTKALDFDWIRYGSGYTVQLLAGFYRSPDVMGWHAAAAAMLSLVLVFAGRDPGRWRWLAVTGIAIAALAVSGRRKMVYMLPFFLLMVVLLILQSRKRGLDLQSLVLLALPLLIAFSVGNWLGAESEFVRYYTDNPNDVAVQAQRHGWEAVIGTFQQTGFWGSGLGFATPGAQNIPFPRPRVWQESGMSRLMVELGVPGLLMMLVFIGNLLMAGLRSARWQFAAHAPFGRYSIALLAFVLANIASLAISGQILADPFIACFIGLMMGMQLSLTRLAWRLRAAEPVMDGPPQAAIAAAS